MPSDYMINFDKLKPYYYLSEEQFNFLLRDRDIVNRLEIENRCPSCKGRTKIIMLTPVPVGPSIEFTCPTCRKSLTTTISLKD